MSSNEYKKVFDAEERHQKWCRFKVMLFALTPMWLAVIGLIILIRTHQQGYWK